MIACWNYRVVREKVDNGYIYNVCTVYYDENNVPISYEKNENIFKANHYEDVKNAYERLILSFYTPVLEVIEGELVELYRVKD